MITAIKKDGNKLSYDFILFAMPENKSFSEERTFKSEEWLRSNLEMSIRGILLINFERYIFINKEFMMASDEVRVKSFERCVDANKYFNETEGLSLRKISEMIIKMQKHLLTILPTTNNERYEKQFSDFNILIGAAKQIHKDIINNNTEQ